MVSKLARLLEFEPILQRKEQLVGFVAGGLRVGLRRRPLFAGLRDEGVQTGLYGRRGDVRTWEKGGGCDRWHRRQRARRWESRHSHGRSRVPDGPIVRT